MKSVFSKFSIVLITLIMLINPTVAAFSADVTLKFSDVSPNAWYTSSVDYVTEKGIMIGTSKNEFSPDTTFTRAMTVQVLARLSGDDISVYTSTEFPDVPDGKWFTKAVAWAVDKGIAQGDGKLFNPDAAVSREQLSLMIANFASKYEISNRFAAGPEDLSVFTDNNDVSVWAEQGIQWAVYNGIISGTGNSKLSPKGVATRAQAAKIFYYIDYMKDNGTIPPDTTEFDKLTVSETNNPRFVCWGDSMSQGYPQELRKLTRISTMSYSSGGDTAEHMAMKQGGLALYAAPFTIPAEKIPVVIPLLDYKLEPVVSFADLGGRGLTPAYINGIEGALYYREAGDCYYFERTTAGEEIKIDRLTRIVTDAMTDQRTGDIHIIYSVANSPSVRGDVEDLIRIQRSMIDYANTDKFVIIGYAGFSSKDARIAINNALKNEYGDQFLDFGEYLITDGFRDAGIEPTEEDLKNIEDGRIPKSFRSDEIHGNHIFDELLANQLYLKLVELDYIDPIAI